MRLSVLFLASVALTSVPAGKSAFAGTLHAQYYPPPSPISLPPTGEMNEMATIPDFSLTTLTTTGYGDIVPIDPVARSLANLESVLGQSYLAVTVDRLVTLELAGRRR